jgi:hypothetical protein
MEAAQVCVASLVLILLAIMGRVIASGYGTLMCITRHFMPQLGRRLPYFTVRLLVEQMFYRRCNDPV